MFEQGVPAAKSEWNAVKFIIYTVELILRGSVHG